MNLVVDIGNTLIKMAVFQDDIILKKKTFLKSDFFKNLDELEQQFPKISAVLISSVSKTSNKWVQRLEEKYQLYILNPGLPQLFKNLYLTPGTLGNDRIGLASAACKKYPEKNVLIIDAGTCITYDFKNERDEYLGGAISPGIQLRFKALNTFTENLPLLEPEEPVKLLGNSTHNCLQSGVILGTIFEIEGFIEAYKANYKELIIIFTGGDAQLLCKQFKNSIFANSNFLLEGLNYILEYNKSQ